MQDFHDQLLAEGVISVLWTQFLMQTNQQHSELASFSGVVKHISLMMEHLMEWEFSDARKE